MKTNETARVSIKNVRNDFKAQTGSINYCLKTIYAAIEQAKEDDKQESANQIEQDVFQYYLTDCSPSDVEYLRANFGLKFAYSEKLELWVLLVTHFGTSWDYVSCETKIQAAAAELGETLH